MPLLWSTGMETQMAQISMWHRTAWFGTARMEQDRGTWQMKVSVGGADDQGVQAQVPLQQCAWIMCCICSLLQLTFSLEILHIHHIIFTDGQRPVQILAVNFFQLPSLQVFSL